LPSFHRTAAFPSTAPPRRGGFFDVGGSRLLLVPLLPPAAATATRCCHCFPLLPLLPVAAAAGPLIPSVVAALYWVVQGSSNCCIAGLKVQTQYAKIFSF